MVMAQIRVPRPTGPSLVLPVRGAAHDKHADHERPSVSISSSLVQGICNEYMTGQGFGKVLLEDELGRIASYLVFCV